MSASGGLRYHNLKIGSGTTQLRLQQVRQFRARLAGYRARSQMSAPVRFVVTKEWCDQQNPLGNQLGVLLLFLLFVARPCPK